MNCQSISVTCLLVVILGFYSEGQAVDVKAGMDQVKNLVDTFNFNLDEGLPTLIDFFQRLMKHCRKNNVNIDLKALLSAYSCLGTLNNTLGDGPSEDPLGDGLFEKICTQWPETKECILPIVSQMELCIFSDLMKVDGILIDIMHTLKKPFCTADTKFFDDIIDDIPPTFTCMTKHVQAIIADAVECFSRNPEENSQVKQTSDSKQICKNFDHYMKCFEESFDVCNNRRVGKLVYKLIEELGFKKLFYKRVFRCTSNN